MDLPYDVKFNYLMFAKDYLVNEYQSSIERITLSYPDLNDSGMREAIAELKYPTREDIFTLAKEILDFIDRKY